MAKRPKRIPRYVLKEEAEKEAARQKIIETGVWDPKACTEEYYRHEMARMPMDAIPADMTKHAPHNSDGPPFWYRDSEFTCKDCGQYGIWTAKEQQWWYEVAKGPVYSTASRCHQCSKLHRDQHKGTPRRLQTERARTPIGNEEAGKQSVVAPKSN